jgi:hypothetical protein
MTPRSTWRVGLWIGMAALCAANVLVFLVLVLPAREARIETEGRIRDLERSIQGVQQAGQSSATFLTAVREVDEYSQGFPRRADLVGLMTQLTRLARSLALQIPDVDYRPSELKEAALTKVTVQMGVEGTYEKIRRLLYELEGMRRFLVIERVTLKDQKAAAMLQVQLQLALYLR